MKLQATALFGPFFFFLTGQVEAIHRALFCSGRFSIPLVLAETIEKCQLCHNQIRSRCLSLAGLAQTDEKFSDSIPPSHVSSVCIIYFLRCGANPYSPKSTEKIFTPCSLPPNPAIIHFHAHEMVVPPSMWLPLTSRPFSSSRGTSLPSERLQQLFVFGLSLVPRDCLALGLSRGIGDMYGRRLTSGGLPTGWIIFWVGVC